jgi:hypothetical protein
MGAGHLDPSAFESLLDANPGLASVELSNYGEMFLNPRLTDILRIAFERKVVLQANNGANLNHASADTLEALVKYRLHRLTVSLDGACSETYSRYRVKGDFQRVLGHIEQINRLKREHGTGFPLLTWQFIVFGHNEHEVAAAKSMAAGLGMAFRSKISWDDEYSPVRDKALVQISTGGPATRAEYYKATGKEYQRSICYQLWQAPVLNWDGRVMGCCHNFWGDFGGNAFRDGLTAALSSPGITQARMALMGRSEMNADAPCATCDLYLTMKGDGKWLSADEIESLSRRNLVETGVVIDPGNSPAAQSATHADIFMATGHAVDRVLLACAPKASRLRIGTDYSVVFAVPPGDYTICVLPKRLDPAFRVQFPALPPVTLPVTIAPRPAVQEFRIRLS